MGLYDRDYTREHSQHQFRNAPQMRFTLPSLTPVVKWLLIINIAVFFIAIIAPSIAEILYGSFQLDSTSMPRSLQFWRLITYQFLHGSVMHLLFNMLGLFFLGPTLERHWTGRRFLPFYLGCGVAGGLFYLLLTAFNFLPAGQMVGASGAILGMLAACAILFPHFVVFFLFFPIPIRIAAVALTIIYIAAIITKGSNAGGDAAHLAGMAAGAIYVLARPMRSKMKFKVQSNQYQKKVSQHQNFQAELDRILQKVHESGIHSLTSREKKILKKATEAEQTRDRF